MADAMNAHRGVPIARPARVAAARISLAGLLLGTLGLAASVLVIIRLFEAWRVTSHAGAHRTAILGLSVTYPAANTDAVVILGLAVLGLAVIAIAVVAAAREIRGSIRLTRSLKPASPAPIEGVFVIRDEVPRSFCAGLLRPRIYVSSAAVSLLDEAALDAVLAHERHHAQRRDPLRFATVRAMSRALFFLPPMAELARRQRSLAEVSADETAIDAAFGGRSALARAMLAFGDSSTAEGVGIDAARVDYLTGETISWSFPVLPCLAVASVLALIGAVAVLAGEVASGAATLAPPLVSRQPCVVVLAMIPTAIALVAGYFTLFERHGV